MKTAVKLKIFMMDLLATVPYYTAYLSRALLSEGLAVQVGSISYYLDLDCFQVRGLKIDPGLLDVVGKFQIPKGPRRILKLAESMLNMAALAVRFLVSPPDVVHVQLRWPDADDDRRPWRPASVPIRFGHRPPYRRPGPRGGREELVSAGAGGVRWR